MDNAGTLYVADTTNNRVLVFWSAWYDSVADVVIGQNSFSTNTPGSGSNQLRAPEGVHFDTSTGALWVADTGNNRVLKFTSITTGAGAALAIGGSGSASSRTMSAPRGLLTDAAGGLYVADTGFSRVLRFAPPLSGGMAASTVFGHGGSMSNGSANQGGVSAGSLAYPEKIKLDPGGRLFVADTGNNRVLEFDSPLGYQVATRVFGQASRSQVPNFGTNVNDAPDAVVNAAGLYEPRGMALDSAGTLWVCDWGNSRILGYNSPLAGQTAASITADVVLGKPDFISAYANLPNSTRMNNPVGVAVDRSASPNHLWVVDLSNSRVLGYNSSAVANNEPADLILGQSGFSDGSTNAGINGPLQNVASMVASAGSLFYPVGVAVDSHGGVYVGDNSNNRVPVFRRSLRERHNRRQGLRPDEFFEPQPVVSLRHAGFARRRRRRLDRAGRCALGCRHRGQPGRALRQRPLCAGDRQPGLPGAGAGRVHLRHHFPPVCAGLFRQPDAFPARGVCRCQPAGVRGRLPEQPGARLRSRRSTTG